MKLFIKIRMNQKQCLIKSNLLITKKKKGGINMNYRNSSYTKNRFSVLKESDPKKVPHEIAPSIYPNREYFVCYGDVKWFKDMDYTKSVYVLARRWGKDDNGEYWESIAPAHILPEDINNVLEAIIKIKNQYLKNE